MTTKTCNVCHGGGKVTVWDPVKKTYKQVPCYGCGGSGVIIL